MRVSTSVFLAVTTLFAGCGETNNSQTKDINNVVIGDTIELQDGRIEQSCSADGRTWKETYKDREAYRKAMADNSICDPANINKPSDPVDDSEIKVVKLKMGVKEVEFATIPATGDAVFTMGSSADDIKNKFADPDEVQHKVVLTKGFLAQTTEFTRGQYKAVMGEAELNKLETKCYPRVPQDNHPLSCVSWNDVQAFVKVLNAGKGCGDTSTPEGFDKARKTSGCYRLPTEAEWEYMARAGTKTPFNLGENISPTKVNYDGGHPFKDAAKGEDRNETVAVGSLGNANAWKLSDMHGNVWEWSQDGYDKYDLNNTTDPVRHSGSSRVIRGGSWYNSAKRCRSADRSDWGADVRLSYVGFRLVRTL